MSRFFYLTIALIFTAGCNTSSNVSSDVKTIETNNAVNKAVNNAVVAATNRSNANVETPVNANKIIIQNSMIGRDNVRNWEAKKGGVKENTPIAAKIDEVMTAAPDNSEVSNQMNDKGEPVETRTFKSHRVLAKIERTNLDNRNIKVYLKNGKAVNLPEGKVDNFLTAAADDILKAVGN